MDDGHEKILRALMERCQRTLAGDAHARAYLQRAGVTDTRVWDSFRVGVCDGHVEQDMGAALKPAFAKIGVNPIAAASVLSGSALLLPTFDPRQPEHVAGLIALRFNQNKHCFISRPAGVACAPDINDHGKVVLVDAPLLGMRLAQAGVRGVIVAEVPEVLPPVAGWLAGKEIVVAAYKRTGMLAMKSALGALAEKAAGVLIASDFEKTGLDALLTLGIPPETIKPTAMLPVAGEITPAVLHELHKYALARLQNGEGIDVLRGIGADLPELVEVYGLGYLPSNFRDALPAHIHLALADADIGGSVILPAYDEQNTIVDLLAVRADATTINLNSPLAGLIAPRITTAFEEIFVVDSLTEAAKRFRAGQRNVLLLRGAEDARLNAHRIWAAGVSHVEIAFEHARDEIAAALKAVGLSVTLPGMEPAAVATPEPVAAPSAAQPVAVIETPELIEHDTKKQQARFKAGDATYTAEVDADGGAKLELRLEHSGKIHHDRFDLACEAQRRRFAASAAMRTQIPFEAIESHLIVLLDSVRGLQEQAAGSGTKADANVMTSAEREEALAYLQRADLLDAIAADLEVLGWAGEEVTKRLMYLISVSRKLIAPLSGALRASPGAGKSTGIETIVATTPPEDVVHVSRLTDSALYYQRDALRHRLVVLDEADAMTGEVAMALRVLQSRGVLSQSHAQRDPLTGTTTTQFIQARGPIAILTSSAGEIETQMLSRCFEIAIDESQEQTRRVFEAQRLKRLDMEHAIHAAARTKIERLHQNLQRLIEPLPVLTPFVNRIEFPDSSVQHRREHERFLNLIEASALLHQHQRMKKTSDTGEVFIVADTRDYQIAVDLAGDSIGRAGDELTRNARDLLGLLQSAKLTDFDINDLSGLRPDWSRYHFRAGLDELLRLEILTSPVKGRGKLRQYHLEEKAVGTLEAPAVHLLTGVEVGELAKVGETHFANFIPVAAMS